MSSKALRIHTSRGDLIKLHKKGNKSLGVWHDKEKMFIVGIKQPDMIRNKDGSLSSNPEPFTELLKTANEDEAISMFESIDKLNWHITEK